MLHSSQAASQSKSRTKLRGRHPGCVLEAGQGLVYNQLRFVRVSPLALKIILGAKLLIPTMVVSCLAMQYQDPPGTLRPAQQATSLSQVYLLRAELGLLRLHLCISASSFGSGGREP